MADGLISSALAICSAIANSHQLFYISLNLLNHQSIGDISSFGFKSLAASLVAIWLISLYPNPLNQLIYRRPLKLGILMGILLLIAAGIDEWVVHYYSVGIRAE